MLAEVFGFSGALEPMAGLSSGLNDVELHSTILTAS